MSGVSWVALYSLELADQTLLPVEESSFQLRPREEFLDGRTFMLPIQGDLTSQWLRIQVN